MGKPLIYDAIVIGAGPAGSVTSRTIASAGFRVLMLEKNSVCMSPCAGYISKTINLDSPSDTVIQSRITGMRTYFPDLSVHDIQLNGFVVDRPLFDMELAMKSEEAGTIIRWNAKVSEINKEKVIFTGGKASGRFIVGADGVFSKTASLLGLKKQRFVACAQYLLKNMDPVSQTCEIFFNVNYAPGGFAWIYPVGKNSAKVGVGITKNDPRTYLEHFVKRFDGTKISFKTGALPVGGLSEKLVYGNILLAGDSAGMADPITGAGINNALLAGEIAGKTIIESLEKDDLEILNKYESRIQRLLGKPFARSLEKRRKMDVCNNNDLLQKYLPELWVAFKNYWD